MFRQIGHLYGIESELRERFADRKQPEPQLHHRVSEQRRPIFSSFGSIGALFF